MRSCFPVLLLFVLAAGCSQRRSGGHPQKPDRNGEQQSEQHGAPETSAQDRRCLPLTFGDLAAAADAAVVQVRTRQEKPSRSGRRRITGEGLGSAFVYDTSGLLLTNHHVVADATEIRVVFKNGRDLSAKVIGSDPPTDVAVLKVNESALPALTLGNSQQLRVGDWVLAIGNPFGLSHTVSAGIVSAKGRTLRDLDSLGSDSGYFDFLQTDASINPGNSGGPLIDLGGRVVGISTAIRAHSNNIGFAIPIDMVRELLPALVSVGQIRRSALGVRVDPVLVEDVQRLHLSDTTGAIVKAVQPSSAAARAGFRVNDVIVEFSGQPIMGPERLRWLASMAGVGRIVTVKVMRGTVTLELKPTLDALPNTPNDASDETEDGPD